METEYSFDSLSTTLEIDLLLKGVADEQLAIRAKQITKSLTDIVDDFAKRETHINETFLPNRRESEMGVLRNETVARIAQTTGTLRTQLAELETDLSLQLVPPPPDASQASISLQIERRALLRQMDGLDRKAVLAEAVQRSDSLTIDALRTAPFFEKLISAAELQQAIDAFARIGKRDVAGRLSELRTVRVAVENAVASATRRVGPISDGVTVVA